MSIITLTSEQKIAYNAIGQYQSLFLSGAAGCGKSVIITEKIKNDSDNEFVLCALTNQAAKVLTEKLNTGEKVRTIHSVLGMMPVHDASTTNPDEITEFKFETTAQNLMGLVGKSLIVDESSMMSSQIQNYIFELLSYGNLDTVTFVGDPLQLQCVKGEPFNYDMVDKTIELIQVKRAQNDLLRYYNQVRSVALSKKTDDRFAVYEDAKVFEDPNKFVEYMKNYEGSKAIITYRNAQADHFSALIDSSKPYVDQRCRALSQCSYPSYKGSEHIGISANSDIKILEIFKDYQHMSRAAEAEEYGYKLPNKPQQLTLEKLTYAKVLNDESKIVYISIFNGYEDAKKSLLLNYINNRYRLFQDKVKRIVNSLEWKKVAKPNGYLSKLRKLPVHIYQNLPLNIKQEDSSFWNDFFAVSQALSIRSIYVSTAHRAQGITVDIAGIDISDLDRSESKSLVYVALTRASQELVFYKGESF